MQNEQVCLYISRTFNPLDEQSDLTSFPTEKNYNCIYVVREGYYQWEDHGSFSTTYKGTNGGRAISISACDDHQISLDTTVSTEFFNSLFQGCCYPC